MEEYFHETKDIFELFRTTTLVTDAAFDRIYPPALREFSKIHWTPVPVAKRAAALLVQSPETRILDIGAGCGKFCLIGALTTDGDFHGIEQRDYLVKFSNHLVARHELPRISYRQGNMMDLDWSSFDAFYLFNPFYENIAAFYEPDADSFQIDRSFPFGEDRFELHVECVRNKLKAVKTGTRVVTYHGFGGEFPKGFKRRLYESFGAAALELWVKEHD